MVTRLLPGVPGTQTRSGITVHRFPDEDGAPFTAHARRTGLFADADVVCLFGVGHDPVAAWWQPVLDAPLAPAGVRLLKVATDGDIIQRGIPAQFYRRLDGVCCQTARIAEEARSVGVMAASCFPVRNGLPLTAWTAGLPSRQAARDRLAIPSGKFVVVGLGRFVERKRFPDLVQAFARFAADTASDAERPLLVLHGSDFGQHDGEEPLLRKLVTALPGGVDVRFVSPDVDVRVTLAAADVCATLSEREGAPNVFIEAFAVGVPVVATDLVGHRVYVTDGVEGLLTPIRDPKTAARALASLHRERAWLTQMSRAARERANHFDISRTADDYLHAFAMTRALREESPS